MTQGLPAAWQMKCVYLLEEWSKTDLCGLLPARRLCVDVLNITSLVWSNALNVLTCISINSWVLSKCMSGPNSRCQNEWQETPWKSCLWKNMTVAFCTWQNCTSLYSHNEVTVKTKQNSYASRDHQLPSSWWFVDILHAGRSFSS